MIITRQKTGDDILKILSGKNKVFVIGCGECAATCKTGGEEDVQRMADFLRSQGKEVTGMITPDVTCVSAQVKIAFAKSKEALKKSEAVLVLACGSGIQCVKENDRLDLNVYPGCDSLFSALIDKDNNFKEVCSFCGECLLDLTEGICPVTRCAKGLLNGPCGGQDKGKCEVDKDRDCAWILIYERLKSKGRLDDLKERQPAKDHRSRKVDSPG
jgi:ferredoxin